MTCLIKATEFQAKLKRIALQILENSRDGETLCLVGLHARGVPFAKRVGAILRQESRVLEEGTLDITMYRDDLHKLENSLAVRETRLDFPLDGRRVILFDDVIMTGRTIRAALNALLDYGRPSRVELAVVVDRGGRDLPVQPDYAALRAEIPPTRRVSVTFTPMDPEDGVFTTDRTP